MDLGELVSPAAVKKAVALLSKRADNTIAASQQPALPQDLVERSDYSLLRAGTVAGTCCPSSLGHELVAPFVKANNAPFSVTCANSLGYELGEQIYGARGFARRGALSDAQECLWNYRDVFHVLFKQHTNMVAQEPVREALRESQEENNNMYGTLGRGGGSICRSCYAVTK